MAVKETVKRYSLDALAAECYPFYSGQMNLPSSWLADEGIIVDTEGDIGHTMVMYMLNLAAKGERLLSVKWEVWMMRIEFSLWPTRGAQHILWLRM